MFCRPVLLARCGDTLMLHLLLHASLFAPLPNGCLLQLSGPPAVEVQLTQKPCNTHKLQPFEDVPPACDDDHPAKSRAPCILPSPQVIVGLRTCWVPNVRRWHSAGGQAAAQGAATHRRAGAARAPRATGSPPTCTHPATPPSPCSQVGQGIDQAL